MNTVKTEKKEISVLTKFLDRLVKGSGSRWEVIGNEAHVYAPDSDTISSIRGEIYYGPFHGLLESLQCSAHGVSKIIVHSTLIWSRPDGASIRSISPWKLKELPTLDGHIDWDGQEIVYEWDESSRAWLERNTRPESVMATGIHRTILG